MKKVTTEEIKKNFGFDEQSEQAFKSIIGVNEDREEKPETGKGRPKVERETKKRISLAVYPSVYNNLQKIAYVDRQSVSDIVSELIAKYVNTNSTKLKEYDKIKSK